MARSTFRSENVQNTPWSDHFWKLRCRKSARRCGAKHVSKSKCTKHTSAGPVLEVEMSKKCTPLWREAHFEVKMYKAHHVRTFLEVQMSKKCTPLWREAHFQVKMYKTHHVRTFFGGSDVVSRGRRKGLWTLSKVSKTRGSCSIFNHNHHYTTLQCITLQLQLHLHYILLPYTPLHYTALNYITLHYTQLDYNYNYTPLHSATLNYTTLHYTTLDSTTLHYITQHYLTLNDTAPQEDRQIDRWIDR